VEIVRNLKVPTGNILVVKGEKGNLERLSLGDYGKQVNIKCDAMGLKRDIERVEHTTMLPLSEKWVITISTQYGCSMGCQFCDVPKVGPGINATNRDLISQVRLAMDLHPDVKEGERLNIHFARMGEPTWNPNVLQAVKYFRLYKEREHMAFYGRKFKTVHPVVSTMMPKNNEWLEPFLRQWIHIKNELYEGEAGLQLSINTTAFLSNERQRLFNGNSLDIMSIAHLMNQLPKPVGRKITLNFAIAGFEMNAKFLRGLFDPEYYICKLTPMHKTKTALANDIKTKGDYTEYHPYKKIEEDLKEQGFDVLVFIASKEEDLGRITCGNAILAGTLPEVPYEEIKVDN
jgi:23S rRNA (adenine2503-C2)-methyltransferase